jgi:hypothetical protein
VQHDRVARRDPLRDFERPPAGRHEVLGDQLEPVDSRHRSEHVRVVLRAQTDAEAEVGQVEPSRAPRAHRSESSSAASIEARRAFDAG